jgi:hypothetical protein
LTASWPCIASTTNSVSTGLERGVQVADLGHQRLVDRQAAGGVDQQHVEVVRLAWSSAASAMSRGFCRARREPLGAGLRRHGLQLLDGGRAVDVGRHRQHLLLALLDQVLGQLGGGGGLARALQAGHQDHGGRLGGQVDVATPSPMVAASSLCTTPTSAWPGVERAHHLRCPAPCP